MIWARSSASGLVPAVQGFHGKAFAGPFAGHEQDALGSRDHGLLLHLHAILQRQVGTGAAVCHDFAQSAVERLVLESHVVHESQAIEAGGVFAAGADTRRQGLTDDVFCQRAGPGFELVPIIKAALCCHVDFLRDARSELLDQV